MLLLATLLSLTPDDFDRQGGKYLAPRGLIKSGQYRPILASVTAFGRKKIGAQNQRKKRNKKEVNGKKKGRKGGEEPGKRNNESKKKE